MGGKSVESEVGQEDVRVLLAGWRFRNRWKVLGGNTFTWICRCRGLSSIRASVIAARWRPLGIHSARHIAVQGGPLPSCSLGKEPLRPDSSSSIDFGDGGLPLAPSVAVNYRAARRCRPVPLRACGRLEEGFAISEFKDKPHPVERSFRPSPCANCSTLRVLLDRKAGIRPRRAVAGHAGFVVRAHLLVAEDNPVNQEIMSVISRRNPHQLKMAGNGYRSSTPLEREAFRPCSS